MSMSVAVMVMMVLMAMAVVVHSLDILPRAGPPLAFLPLAMQGVGCWMVDNTPARIR